jgi:hypothetical protein
MPRSWSFPCGHAASASAFSYAVGRHLPQLAVPLTLLAGIVTAAGMSSGGAQGSSFEGWPWRVLPTPTGKVADRYIDSVHLGPTIHPFRTRCRPRGDAPAGGHLSRS